ncbi:MAG: Asp-tRNA(Asn)/Glu-tRNA(Gln) amidotransferase subunit GatC [Myxococcaceae bacterium]
MALTLEQVRHVASLARLQLSAEEEALYQQQLSHVLDAVEQLKAVDTEGVEPTSHANFGQSLLREDVVKPSLPPEKSLLNAPSKVDTAFAVPKIIE